METFALRANGTRFAALADGPVEGPLVLLLHGFPELSRSWRRQLPALAAAGYRAVAPDLRGYGGSERRGPYDLGTLAADAAGMVTALGRDRAVVVGHDWGGAVAWETARRHPEVVERLVVLNCPPASVLARELRRNPRQLRRSAYMLFFQLPWLPEWLLTRNQAAAVARALRGGSHVRSAWPPEELEHYRRALLQPGAARAALGYYRAALRARPRGPRPRPIAAPTLVLWGVLDRFLCAETVSRARLAPVLAPGNEPEVVWIEGAGHFLQNEVPERVNAELLRWLGPAR